MSPAVGSSNHQRISRGAAQLLHIAFANDARGALARHLALTLVIELAGRLPEAARRGPAGIRELLEAPRDPQSFLELSAALVGVVRRRQEAAYGTGGGAGPVVWSEFDHQALQALAQALADAIWHQRDADSVAGPALAACIDELANASARTLVELLLQHYVGNLLQTYFTEAGVRRSVAGLPKDTEELLRSRDAALVARRVMRAVGDIVTKPGSVSEALRAELLAIAAGAS